MEVATKEAALEALKHAPPLGSLWRHFRNGHLYTIVGHSIIERTLEPAVTYVSHADQVRWTRTIADFRQIVANDKGDLVPRFSLVLETRAEVDLCPDCLGGGCEPCNMRGTNVKHVP